VACIEKVSAKKVLFIKLGNEGAWEKECIENRHCLKLGRYEGNSDKDYRTGNWDRIKKTFISAGINSKTATDYTRQIREFYSADDSTIWITFYSNKLWWCFAKNDIKELSDGSIERKANGKWSDKDIYGTILSTDKLSGKLLKTQGYRGTICKVEEAEYVVRKINGETLPDVSEAITALDTLNHNLEKLIKHLEWSDFELLVDLIFTNAGWQRIGRRGETEKTLDLDLLSPVTNEKVMVQIKSKSNMKEFTDYKSRYSNMNNYDRMFYVVHSPDDKLMNFKKDDGRISVLCSHKIAELAISAGLTNWIIGKTA
jgi:hypothetical protein